MRKLAGSQRSVKIIAVLSLLLSTIVLVSTVPFMFDRAQGQIDDVEDDKGDDDDYNLTELSASYIIFQDGPWTMAKNGTTSKIDFRSLNASETIQAAADAIDGAGGAILIKRGTYIISYPINLHNNTILSGEGGGDRGYNSKTILQANKSIPYMVGATLTQRNYGITIENMRIMCYYNVDRGIYIPYAMYCTIENVFQHGAKIGIELGGPQDGFDSNDVNFIRSCETRGHYDTLYREEGTIGIYLRSNDAYITDCISAFYWTTFKFGGQGSIFFDNNHVNLAGHSGLSVAYGTWYVRISNCDFDNIRGWGLILYHSSYISVSACSFFSIGQQAIKIMGSNDVSVTGSSFNKNGAASNCTYPDISIEENSRFVTISGNTFSRTVGQNGTSHAVWIANTSNNVSVTGNTFSSYLDKAVYVEYPYTDVIIDRNIGYVLHAHGNAKILAGNNSVSVQAGISPYSSIGTVFVAGSSNNTREAWVDGTSEGEFIICVPSSVPEDSDIYWEVWASY